MSRSPFQRFVSELRRRHVPQTAAIYLVAAWAAIQFADVVVPNLNGPQWVVTAVIVATLVGFPVMLVVAWVFEWGPEGLHRTADGAGAVGDPGGGGTAPARAQPWLAVAAVLVVGIGSALAAAYLIRGSDTAEEGAAPTARDRTEPRREAGEPASGLAVPEPPPEMEALGPGFADSIRATMMRAFGELDSMDLRDLAELGREAAAEAGLGVVITAPEEWRGLRRTTPVPLARGDTLVVEGAAYDTAGVALVTVDDDTVAAPDSPRPTVPFSTTLTGRSGVGNRTVVIIARTGDGREIRRELQIIQLPGGVP